MKAYKVVPTPMPHATIEVEGQPRHYFQSEKLGSCYAFKPTPPQQSHVDMVNEEIDRYEQEQAAKEAEKDFCENCVQGGWFTDKDGSRKFLMPPYPTVDTICLVCGGYASPERKAQGKVRWGELG